MPKLELLEQGFLDYQTDRFSPIRYTYCLHTNPDDATLCISFEKTADLTSRHASPVTLNDLELLLDTNTCELCCWFDTDTASGAGLLCINKNDIPQAFQNIQQAPASSIAFMRATIKVLHDFNENLNDPFLIPPHSPHEAIASNYSPAEVNQSASVQPDELFLPIDSSSENDAESSKDSSENQVHPSLGTRNTLSLAEQTPSNPLSPGFFSSQNHANDNASKSTSSDSGYCCCCC